MKQRGTRDLCMGVTACPILKLMILTNDLFFRAPMLKALFKPV